MITYLLKNYTVEQNGQGGKLELDCLALLLMSITYQLCVLGQKCNLSMPQNLHT